VYIVEQGDRLQSLLISFGLYPQCAAVNFWMRTQWAARDVLLRTSKSWCSSVCQPVIQTFSSVIDAILLVYHWQPVKCLCSSVANSITSIYQSKQVKWLFSSIAQSKPVKWLFSLIANLFGAVYQWRPVKLLYHLVDYLIKAAYEWKPVKCLIMSGVNLFRAVTWLFKSVANYLLQSIK
jgi:hypothetical protein